MSISIILAMTDEGVIGKDNKLPWHLPEDLARFKSITMGHPIIMGRKTYESIGKPLPGRTNIVLTKNRDFRPGGVIVVDDFQKALNEASKSEGGGEAFVIGGAALFKTALPLSDRLFLTIIHDCIPGDTFAPKIDLDGQFRVSERTDIETTKADRLHCSFLVADRISR